MAIDNVGKLRSPSVNEPIADSLFISTASTTAEQGFFQWDSSVIFGNPQGFGTTFDKRQLDNVNGFSINDIFPHVDFYEQDLYPAIKKPITAGKVGAFHSSGSTEFSVSIHPFNKGSANFIIGDPTLSTGAAFNSIYQNFDSTSLGYNVTNYRQSPDATTITFAPSSPFSCTTINPQKRPNCGVATRSRHFHHLALEEVTESNRIPLSEWRSANLGPYSTTPPLTIEGDLNGDGHHDWVIGVGAYANFKHLLSHLVISYGYSGPTIESELNYLSTPRTGSNGFTVTGWVDQQVAFFSMANLNNDAYSDLVLSFPDATVNGRAQAGRTYVLFGRANFRSNVDITRLSLAEGLVIEGSVANGRFGSSLLAMGNDGVIIGGLANAEQSSHVCGYSVLFSRDDFSDVVKQNTAGQTATMSSESLNNHHLGFTIAACTTEGHSGRVDITTGDFNGDGEQEILLADGDSGLVHGINAR